MPEIEDEVIEANQAFYDAFETRDFDAMSDLWIHGDEVWCTHPGHRRLRGWGSVGGSWVALFQGSEHLQFILTDLAVTVHGDTAVVTLDENILNGTSSAGTVAATNVFVRRDRAWKLCGHHGSPVQPT